MENIKELIKVSDYARCNPIPGQKGRNASVAYYYKLIKEGRLKAMQIGDVWLVNKNEKIKPSNKRKY